jgi:hypothetical protein
MQKAGLERSEEGIKDQKELVALLRETNRLLQELVSKTQGH